MRMYSNLKFLTKPNTSRTRIRNLFVAAVICSANWSRAADGAGAVDGDRLRRLEEAVLQLQQENHALRQQVQELKSSGTNIAPTTNATDKTAFVTNATDLAANGRPLFVLP